MDSKEINTKIEELFLLRTEICKPINDRIEILLQEMRLALEIERKTDE